MQAGVTVTGARLATALNRVRTWIDRSSVTLLRASLGIVFLWFGVLKFFPGLSPAEDLAGRTIDALSFGLIKPSLSLPVLAVWECAIGIGFMVGRHWRIVLTLMLSQMAGTLLPLFLFPLETFSVAPIAPSLEGQYIIKNIVLIGGGLVVAASERRRAQVEGRRSRQTRAQHTIVTSSGMG